jgi:hypothetical protein
MSKCKYARTSHCDQYVTSCGYEAVHEEDCSDWEYCPYCGGRIKFKDNATEDEVDSYLDQEQE